MLLDRYVPLNLNGLDLNWQDILETAAPAT